jgi:hypothetical protein
MAGPGFAVPADGLSALSIANTAKLIARDRETVSPVFILPLGNSMIHLNPVGLLVCKIRK